jgi:hypothetical protein
MAEIDKGTQSGSGDITIYESITANKGITIRVRLAGYLPYQTVGTATTAAGYSGVIAQNVDSIYT